MISPSQSKNTLHPPIEIRPIVAADVKSVAKILVDTRRISNKAQLPDSYLKNLTYEKFELEYLTAIETADIREFFLVAAESSGVIGFIHGKPTPDAPGDDSIELRELYICPDHQRRGLGRSLLKEFVGNALRVGIKKVVVWVLKSNAGACAFYEELGSNYSHAATRLIGGIECELVIYSWSENQLKEISGEQS